jgi:outer membrane biosynthesis protein TonB
MSYASFTQSFPDFIKSFPQKLFEPTGIAVMSSVGIHALLAVTLPYLPIASQDKPQPIRNVKLVQLTPAEQSRLPQLSPPSLSPLPNQLQSLYPLPAYPSTPLPSLSSSRDSYLYNLPPISPLPPVGNGSSSSRTSQSSNQQPKSSTQQGTNRQLTVLKDSSVRIKPFNQRPTSLPEITPLPTVPLPHPSIFSRRELSQLLRVNPAPVPEFLNPSQQTGQSPFSSPTLLGAAPEGTNQAMAPTSGQRNSTDNSSASVYSNYNKLATDWFRRNGITTPAKTINISRNYPQKERSSGEPNGGAVVVAVKVDENGKIISDSLQPMGSSFSDGAFDKEALSTIGGYAFPATGKAEAYFVQVQFKDDSTVPSSLTRPQAPSERPSSPERPTSEKPQGSTERPASTERPTSEKPQGSTERPSAEKPQGSTERPTSEKPQGSTERPTSEKPQGSTEHPTSEKPQGSTERPTSEKPQGSTERPTSEKPQGSTERPSAEKPPASPERPSAEKPSASPERPTSEKPPASPERPSAEKPPASPERPSAEKPPASPEG